MKKIVIVKDEEKPIPFEVMEEALVQIGQALKKIEKTRVSKRLIVALIQDDTKLGKGLIETVLNSFDSLEQKYLKRQIPK